jgi:hypothetical protein
VSSRRTHSTLRPIALAFSVLIASGLSTRKPSYHTDAVPLGKLDEVGVGVDLGLHERPIPEAVAAMLCPAVRAVWHAHAVGGGRGLAVIDSAQR